MKSVKSILSIMLLSHMLFLKGQIKVFTGKVSIGSTASPSVNNVSNQLIGTKTLFSSSAATVASAALIRGNAGYSGSSTPDFTWLSDDQTGLFHPSANVIGITVGNSEKFRFNSSGQFLSTISNTSASTPDFSWNSETGSGMFRPTSGAVAFSVLGSEKLRLNSSGQILNSNSTSTVTAPDFSWNSDGNTGIYRPGNDILGLAVNGAEGARLNTDGLCVGTISPSSDAKLALYGALNKFTIQSFSNFNWDGGCNWEINLNRSTTHAIMVYNSASGTPSLTFRIDGTGDATAKSWTTWSDKNLKENFDSIPDALGKVKKLKGWYYNFKAVYSATPIPKKEMGLIAQEVEQVIPEVINVSPDGKKGIVYDNLIGLLVEAIKAQDKKMEQMQNDLNACCNKSGNRIINPQNNNNGDNKGGTNNNLNTNTSITSGEQNTYIKQNVPNPFSKETLIEFYIAEQNASASILIFDMNGKLLKTLKLNGSGNGSITINGGDLQPGMYYYSLIVNQKEIDTKKMILTE